MSIVGRKYIIEIDREYKSEDGQVLYGAKGFNALNFDKNGIDKLKEYREEPEPKPEILTDFETRFNGVALFPEGTMYKGVDIRQRLHSERAGTVR